MEPIPAHLRKLLFNKNDHEALTEEEEKAWKAWIHWNTPDKDIDLRNSGFSNYYQLYEEAKKEKKATWKQLKQHLIQQSVTQSMNSVIRFKDIRRIKIIRYSVAAAVVLALTCTGIWLNRLKSQKQAVSNTLRIEIKPGTRRGFLTLIDKRRIDITQKPEGEIARQEDVSIVKNKDSIFYKTMNKNKVSSGYNTMSTPKGGEYSIVLSDGSKISLNANSTLRYPVTFPGNERIVEFEEGEAYFEVAPNKQKPFIVIINNKRVQVHGTVFNIHAYNKDSVVTTLLTGSVTVQEGNKKAILQPTDKAVLQAAEITISHHADIENEIAWNKGFISLEGKPFKYVMEDIGRWYDVSIDFQINPDAITFKGRIVKKNSFNAVLESLNTIGENEHIHFYIKDRKLIIEKLTNK